MKLADLRAAQVDERGTDSLQPLRETFYEEAAAYLADLRERRDALAEQVDDPFDSEEVRRLNDELETAEEVVEAIYERRVGKLVKRASLAAAGHSADEAGLTEEERELFSDLVDRIEANRETVLETLAGDGPASVAEEEPAEAEAPFEPPAEEPELDPAEPDDAMRGSEPPESPSPEPDSSKPGSEPEPDGGTTTAPRGMTEELESSPEGETDRVTVRVTAAVGEIYGVDDRVYTLDAEDVVTLPAANAKPLIDRGAAHRVD